MKFKCVFLEMVWNFVFYYYYICVELWKNIKNEFLFVSFEQALKKIIIIYIKKSYVIVIY